jgi:hypothetical protein
MTPSPSCLSNYYWTNAFDSLGPPSTSDCLPSGWKFTSQHFSPGLCPSGYVIACSITTALGTFTETQATCCPSSYLCQTRNDYPWYSTEACTRNYNAFPTSSTIYITTIVSSTTTINPLVISAGGVNAYGISIRWQSTDFSAPTTYSPSNISPLSSSPTSFYPSITPTPNTISHSLTPGAAAGISISATLIFVVVVAILTFFILRHRRRSKLEPMSSLQTEPYKDGPQELENFRPQHELHGENETQMITVDGGMAYSAQGSGRRFVELPSSNAPTGATSLTIPKTASTEA